MNPRGLYKLWLAVLIVCMAVSIATAQSFRVQCPANTITHPFAANNNAEPAYTGVTAYGNCTPGLAIPGSTAICPASGKYPTANSVNGAIKCQQVSGGDGYATMGDGTQTYLFAFGPLSGLADIASGLTGAEFPNVFNTGYTGTAPLQPGDPATTVDASAPGSFAYNGAVGQVPHVVNAVDITAIAEGALPAGTPSTGCSTAGNSVTVYTNAPLGLGVGDKVMVSVVSPTPAGYNSAQPPSGFTISCVNNNVIDPNGFRAWAFTYNNTIAGLAAVTIGTIGSVATPPVLDGHVDPRPIMDVGVMNGNIPAPMIVMDEDDEFFLTLTNVGMIMRPDLFEQHTIHFHGYPNASSFFDGVPDASVAINIGGSFTYYYLAPEAGTYFWHCHITPPEHLQMGMVGNLYVRPRQNRILPATTLYQALQIQNSDLRTKCDPATDILCSNPLPKLGDNGSVGGYDATHHVATKMYAYNDGDGSTYYDVEYPLQMHGFDPNFHFVGMTFNPEEFADMKDKYFLLNGRSYPDTVQSGPLETQTADGTNHYSQPLPSIINIPSSGKALLRIHSLDVSEYQTLASLGIPMTVIALNAKLLRDQSGNNLYYKTNSITLGGGESLDVILDATGIPAGTYYLYTSNLDHLSNDAENFGGLMTEVHVCAGGVTSSTFGNSCN